MTIAIAIAIAATSLFAVRVSRSREAGGSGSSSGGQRKVMVRLDTPVSTLWSCKVTMLMCRPVRVE